MGGFKDFFSDVVGSILGGSSAKGDTGDKTVTQTPWSGLQPSVIAALQQAANLYNMGGPQYYPESTVIPFSPQSQLGMGMAENLALQGSQYQPRMDAFYNQVMQGSANNPGMNYLNRFRNTTVDPRQVTAAQIGQTPQVRVGDGLTDLTRQTFNQTMRGNYLNSNPYLDQTYDRASNALTRKWNESVLPGVNSTFSLAGRTGSDAHQNSVNQASQELGTSLSDLGNQIYGQNYQQERERMMNAANSLGGFDTTEQGYGLQASEQNASNALSRNTNQANLAQSARQFNAANDLNAQQFNQGFRMNMGNALNNMYQQGVDNQFAGAGLGQNLMNNEWNNIGRLMDVGGMVENKAGQYLTDNMNRFNYYQNLPYQNFNQYVNNLGGIPGSGFTTSHQDTDLNQGSTFADWVGKGLNTWATGGNWMDMFKQ